MTYYLNTRTIVTRSKTKKNRLNIQRKHGDHADALGLMPSENATTRVARHLCLIINAT